MARHGVTYQDISNATEQIFGRGRNLPLSLFEIYLVRAALPLLQTTYVNGVLSKMDQLQLPLKKICHKNL